MAQEYGNSSIGQLVGADRIRKRPASMLGSSELDGAKHSITEMLGNSLDEATSGFGDKLDVIYYEDDSISIRDYGRGVPLGWNKDRKNWNWHLIYNELYAGGKYDNGQYYLMSVDRWSEWLFVEGDSRKDELRSKFGKTMGYDLNNLPLDGSVVTVKDFDLKRDDSTVYMHINNMSWSNMTWEYLNNRLNYLASVGLNGLGAASTQYTSEFFTVKSYRGGKCTEVNFRNGMPIIDGKVINMFDGSYDVNSYVPNETSTDEPDGTFIHWKPDNTVFSDVVIGGDWLFKVCEDTAHVSNISLHFEDRQAGKVKDIKAGNLVDLLSERCSSKAVLNNDDNLISFTTSGFSHGDTTVEGQPYTWVCRADVAMCFTTDKVETSCYHNAVRMKRGAQHDGVVSAVQAFFKKISQSNGIKLEPRDYDNVLAFTVASYSNYASFRNQTKDAVDNSFIFEIVYNLVLDKLNIEFGKGNSDLQNMINRVINTAQERIAIQEAAKVLKKNSQIKKSKLPEKFHTCKAFINKDYSVTEIWITEGDSAQGAVDKARNSDFQATLPVRGKCLNVLKSALDKILANKEIQDIFNLLGTGMDIGIGSETFDISALRFNKIIFATDADEDGFQIRVLLFLIFYKLAPQLILDGHIYIAETPRFKITLSNGKSLYARDDLERDEILSNTSYNVREVSRFKGLGEVDADVLRETTVHPDSRNLVPLTFDFENETFRELIDALFGNDKFSQRKKILTTALGIDMSDFLEDMDALAIKDDSVEDVVEAIED